MKKIFILFLFGILVTILLTNFAYAATPTPTGDVTEQINKLKERIASRVAELKLVEKRGVIGVVTDVSETQLTITDTNDDTVFIDVDELTKFTSPDAKGSFGISDISKGSTVGILGLYNKESRRILARFVDVMVLLHNYSGVVTDKNSTDFSFTIQTVDNKKLSVDVENITRTYSYTKEDDMVKSGFSKIQSGERIYLVGLVDTKKSNNIIASRIIRFPELPVNSKISISPIPTKSVTPKPTQ